MSDKCKHCGRILLGQGMKQVDIRTLPQVNREFTAPDPSLFCLGTDSEPCLRRQLAKSNADNARLARELSAEKREMEYCRDEWASAMAIIQQQKAEIAAIRAGFDAALAGKETK
jgi:predicted  nucleic acid-binding Zn-ribbon protein